MGIAYQTISGPEVDSGALYDRVPYDGGAFMGSHPNSMAVVASLVGFTPARLDRCRVLEIGCGFGSNLLPIAACYPRSQCIGIDASAVQIKAGREFLATTGLTNVELHHMSVMDIPRSLGEFDYIVCHGVWNIVTPQVREKILQVSRDFLSSNGLAYVGYNTLPGWHWKGGLRDMLRLHASYHTRIEDQVKAVRKFLPILAGSFSESNKDAYAAFVRNESRHIASATDAYVFHEFLADINQPSYFMEFAERAQEAGLEFVAESNLSGSVVGLLEKPLADAVLGLPIDRIEQEQHVDFVRNRSFRQSILCRADAGFHARMSEESIASMSIACAAKPENPAGVFKTGAPEKFLLSSGACAILSDPMQQAALLHLGSVYPQAVSFPDLVEAVTRKAAAGNRPAPTAEAVRELHSVFLQGYLKQIVELHLQIPVVVSTVTPKPIAWPLARAQARKSGLVTNTRHASINLPHLARSVITLLDGTHDHEALRSAISARIESGEFVMTSNDPGVKVTRENRAQLLAPTIEQILNEFCHSALLVG